MINKEFEDYFNVLSPEKESPVYKEFEDINSKISLTKRDLSSLKLEGMDQELRLKYIYEIFSNGVVDITTNTNREYLLKFKEEMSYIKELNFNRINKK